MTGFDTARYYLTILVLVSVPGAVLFWFAIHPFAGFWRRAGVGSAYVAGFGVMIVVGALLFLLRRPLMAVDFGSSWATAGPGIALLVVSAVMRQMWQRQLKLATLFGLPELAPQKYPPKLLTEGIYARVRHPRYLEYSLGAIGLALVCNNAAAYGAVLLTLAGMAVLIPMEERELVARFGPAYEEYRRRVPALVPAARRRNASQSS